MQSILPVRTAGIRDSGFETRDFRFTNYDSRFTASTPTTNLYYAIVKEQCCGNLRRHDRFLGGGERVRTDDLLRARQALSQLSYTPNNLVGLDGLEPSTSRLSVVCSSQLSYRPLFGYR